jgi:hypothetical protein
MLRLNTVDLDEKQPTEYSLSLRCDHWSGPVGPNGRVPSDRAFFDNGRADACTPDDLQNMRELVALFDRGVSLRPDAGSIVAQGGSGEIARFLSLPRYEF